MPAKRWSATLPQLELTADDEHELQALGDSLEKEALDLYEQYLLRHRRRVDTTRWKAVRSQDDLHLYCERDEYRKTWRHKSKLQGKTIGPMLELAVPSSLPMLLVAGTTPGSLEDALYGNMFRDVASLRVRSNYLQQKADDVALLAVVEGPSLDDPLSFLGVTWSSRETPSSLGGHTRDLLLLQGIRSAKLSTGENVGIAFHHSIHHRDLPDSHSRLVRAQASHLSVYRQLDEQRLEVFCIDFTDLRGKVLQSTALKQSMAVLLPRASSCDVGVNKKLYWLMRERHRDRAKTLEPFHRESVVSSVHSSHGSSPAVPEPQQAADAKFCDICDSAFRGNGASSVFAASSCICQLCRENVCSKCVVTKSIAIDATAEYVETKKFAFCVACIHHAKNSSASKIAQRELEDVYLRSVNQRRLSTSSVFSRGRNTSLLE